MIPEPSAEATLVPWLNIELTANSILIPTIEGKTLFAAAIAVSE